MKGNRRQAREDALQILYQLDLNQELTTTSGLYHFEKCFARDGQPIDEFTHELVTGVTQNLTALDALIESVSEHWRIGRMPAVDRNILRLGAYELEHCDKIPATVSINEMIEIAKSFGADTSAAFVNGILDKIRAAHPRPGKAT